jgi:hypothetical protein
MLCHKHNGMDVHELLSARQATRARYLPASRRVHAIDPERPLERVRTSRKYSVAGRRPDARSACCSMAARRPPDLDDRGLACGCHHGSSTTELAFAQRSARSSRADPFGGRPGHDRSADRSANRLGGAVAVSSVLKRFCEVRSWTADPRSWHWFAAGLLAGDLSPAAGQLPPTRPSPSTTRPRRGVLHY